jgi:hypothetical protein
MAIKRITQKPSKFLFGEVVVGVRLPDVEEMKQIAAMRKDYLATVRVDLIEDKRDNVDAERNQDGDAAMLVDIEQRVSQMLCCDPDNARIPWFAKDATEQTALELQNISKDTPSDVPAAFHHIAFQIFTVASASAKPVDFTQQADEEIDQEATDKRPLEAVEPLTERTTTTSSVDNASKSESISESTPSLPLADGLTTSS